MEEKEKKEFSEKSRKKKKKKEFSEKKREEIRKISIQAKEELERLLYSGNKIILYDLGRDKYFRLLASVKVGNIDVAEYMINRGLAKSYNGGAKLKPTEWIS